MLFTPDSLSIADEFNNFLKWSSTFILYVGENHSSDAHAHSNRLKGNGEGKGGQRKGKKQRCP